MIRRKLGDGGGGAVWLASRMGAEQLLAVKILRHRFGIGGKSDRAWRELHILSQIRLPAVPRVADYGVHDGRLYIATEYIEGFSLDEYCRVNDLTLRDRVDLLARVADAVHSLHETGVIHRDIKPSNILVDRNGQPVIIDLGIASLLTDDVMETLTAEGAPIGSPAFMSPEQAMGSRREITTRSDVFGLGATAYLILTGQTPHEMAETIHASVRRVAEDEPRNPRVLDGSFPRDLAAVLAKAVSREPARRYTSAADFAEDLRRWLAGDPVTATPPGPWRRGTRWIARHPIITTSVACAAIALVIVGTSISISRQMNLKPERIVFSKDGLSATLVSISGRPLKTWTSSNPQSHIVAELVRLPSSRPIIITHLNNPADSSMGPTEQLCVWDALHPNELLWDTSDIAAGLTRPTDPMPDDSYRASRWVLVADIYPAEEGPEIMVVFRHHCYSPQAIVVLNTRGEKMFEAWHRGAIGHPYWNPNTRQLAFCGMNNERSWSDLGWMDTRQVWPRVVFAIHIDEEPGKRLGWVNPRMAEDGEAAVWYHFLVPPLKRGEVALSPFLREPISAKVRDRCIQLDVSLPYTGDLVEPGNPLWLWWYIDETGQATIGGWGDPLERVYPDGPPKEYRLVGYDELPRGP